MPAAKSGVGVSVSVIGKTVQLGARTFDCLTSVETLTDEDTRNKQYFVGVIWNNDVFVDVNRPIGRTDAMMILTLNRGNIGVVAVNRNYARGLAGGNQEDRKVMEIADIMSTTIIACIPMPTFGIHLEAKSMESTKR